MSTTLSIACMTCKERVLVGQSNYIYLADRTMMVNLEAFLIKHQSSEYQSEGHVHQLQFLNEHYEPFFHDDWKYFEK